MNPAKTEFVELCLKNEALRFGEFTLKSGRVSPYFFNAGLFNRGAQLSQLAHHYAGVLAARIKTDFILFGPAYKGIPLAAATALKLAEEHQRDVGYAFNRKEAKTHGEGGTLIGAPLRGEVVIIDDVITAGTSINQSIATITAAGATPHAVIIALDRHEIAGDAGLSAVQQIEREHNIPVHSIINLHDLITYLEQKQTDTSFAQYADAVRAYRAQYGAPD